MKKLFVLFLIFTQSAWSQLASMDRKTLIYCSMMEGGAELFEDSTGQLQYWGSFGFLGTLMGGFADVKLTKQEDQCHLEVVAGEAASHVEKAFIWKIPDLLNGEVPEITELSHPVGRCSIQKRYFETLSQCQIPNPENPGSRCFNESSRDATFKFGRSKFTVYSGGFVMFAQEESREVFNIWREKNRWCYAHELFPDECQEIKKSQVVDLQSQIIGTAHEQEDQLRVEFLKNKNLEFKLVLEPNKTHFFVNIKNKNYKKHIILNGEFKIPLTYRSLRQPADLQSADRFEYDCNGPVPSQK